MTVWPNGTCCKLQHYFLCHAWVPFSLFRRPSATGLQSIESWRLARPSVGPFRKIHFITHDLLPSGLVVQLAWEQGCRSGENARLPPMWRGFDSWRQSHMWVEFVVGSLPCSETFFSRCSGFPLSLKTNTSKFLIDLEHTDMFQRVLIELVSAPWVKKLHLQLW